MTDEVAIMDVSSMPDVSRLVREVASTGERRVLRVDGAEAELAPTRRDRRSKALSQDEFEAAMNATYGSLRDLIDPEEFQRQRRALQVDERDPLSL